MEAFGSGGILLLVIAVLWLTFMTPTGQRREKSVKTKSTRTQRSGSVAARPLKYTTIATTPINKGLQAEVSPAPVAEKVVINRLPDPLSARIGSIENVPWAEVKDLDKAREEKAKISSENLDEILKRRRANG
ncbi:MAG: hypothetical protein ACK5CU_02830 [Rhodoluna sp.]|jgi:hypothetical protein